MSRFLLRYNGVEKVPELDIDKIQSMPGVVVVSKSSSKSFILEVSNVSSRDKLSKFPSWKLHGSQTASIDPLSPFCEGDSLGTAVAAPLIHMVK